MPSPKKLHIGESKVNPIVNQYFRNHLINAKSHRKRLYMRINIDCFL